MGPCYTLSIEIEKTDGQVVVSAGVFSVKIKAQRGESISINYLADKLRGHGCELLNHYIYQLVTPNEEDPVPLGLYDSSNSSVQISTKPGSKQVKLRLADVDYLQEKIKALKAAEEEKQRQMEETKYANQHRTIREAVILAYRYKKGREDVAPILGYNQAREWAAMRLGVYRRTLDNYERQVAKANGKGFDFSFYQDYLLKVLYKFNRSQAHN